MDGHFLWVDIPVHRVYLGDFVLLTAMVTSYTAPAVLAALALLALSLGPALHPTTTATLSGVPGIQFAASSPLSSSHSVRSGSHYSSLSIPVGSGPYGVAYNPADGYVYVSDYTQGTISVISPSTNTVVNSLSGPWASNMGISGGQVPGIVYIPDPQALSTALLMNVNVSSPSSTAWAVLNQSGDPTLVSLDPARHMLYVNDLNLGLVYLTTEGGAGWLNSTVATHGRVFAFAYDPSRGEMYVGMSGLIKGIADSNLAVSQNISLGVGTQSVGPTGPFNSAKEALGFAPSSGFLYIGGTGTGPASSYYNLTEVNPATGFVVGHAVVGPSPTTALYDPLDRSIYTTNYKGNNVSILNTSTNAVVATVPVGTEPIDATYCPSNGDVYVTNFGSNNVTVILPATPPPLTSSSSASPSQGNAPLTTWLNASATGGTPPYAYAWRTGDGGSGTGVSLQYTYTTVGVFRAHLWVNDSAGRTAQSNATVNAWAPLASVSSSPSSATLPPMGSQGFTASPACTGGPCPVGTVFSWSFTNGLGALNSSTGSVVKFTAGGVVGRDTLFVNATLNSVKVQGAPVSITISSSAPPSISSFTALPSPIYAGWTTFLNVSASGGTGALSYAFSGLPAGCSSSNATSLPCAPAVSGTFTVRVYVNDTVAHSATTTTSLTVNPSPGGPTIASFAATPPTVPLGSMTTFMVSASGGTGTLSYAYAGLPGGCSTSDTSSLACTPAATGSFTVRAYVNDTAARSATTTTSLMVNPSTGGPIVSSFSANPPTIILGASTTLTVSASGGTGTLSYSYAGLPTRCATSNAASLPCTPGVSGSFTVRVYANDTSSGSATAVTPLTVNPGSTVALASVAITPGVSNISTGGSRAFSAIASCTGGPCPSSLTYSWALSGSLGSLSSQVGATTMFTAGSSPGKETLTVTATLNGVSKTASATIVVAAPASSPPTFLSFPPLEGYLVLVMAISVVAGLSVVLILAQRRSRRRSSSASEDEHVVPRAR